MIRLGDRIANLEQAIVAYRSALDVLTRLSHPEMGPHMIGLASVYLDCIDGDRVQNIELVHQGTGGELLNVFTTEK